MRDNPTASSFPRGKGDWTTAAPRSVALGAVAIYRAAISPVIHALGGPACRFEPSCSAYAHDAIAEYGTLRGGLMALWRIARCNPMGGHGYDPVRPRSFPSCHSERSEESRSNARRLAAAATAADEREATEDVSSDPARAERESSRNLDPHPRWKRGLSLTGRGI